MENAVYSFLRMKKEFWRIYKWLKIESNLSLSLKGIIVCPVGHPSISTLCLWEREMRNFSRREGEHIYDYNKNII